MFERIVQQMSELLDYMVAERTSYGCSSERYKRFESQYRELGKQLPKGILTLNACKEYDEKLRNTDQATIDNRYRFAIGAARQYAAACGTTYEEVLASWETRRDYWWVNFYQECKIPSLNTGKPHKVVMLKDWQAEGERLFGKDPKDWRFVCPACGGVQTGRQFEESGQEPDFAYRNCISRYVGTGKCKYTTGGLLNLAKVCVIDALYRPVWVFDFDRKEEQK